MAKDEKVYNKDSIQLLLHTSESSYNEEHSRTQIIDNKSNISLPIMSAFTVTIIHSMNYKHIFNMPTESFCKWLIPFLLFVFYTAALITSIISVLFMARVIKTLDYKSINVRDLYDEDYLQEERKFLSLEFVNLYVQATEFNKLQNDRRVRNYKIGWYLAVISLILYAFFFIINNVII